MDLKGILHHKESQANSLSSDLKFSFKFLKGFQRGQEYLRIIDVKLCWYSIPIEMLIFLSCKDLLNLRSLKTVSCRNDDVNGFLLPRSCHLQPSPCFVE